MRPAVEAWSLNHWTTREVPKFFIFNLLIFIEVELIYNVVLISAAVQQSESVIHIYTLFFF